MQSSIIAVPVSRNELRSFAAVIRKTVEAQNELYFDVVKFIEHVLPTFTPEFEVQICDADEMGDCHGRAYPELKLIKLREDVYLRAASGEGRDRMTVAHELGHYLLHQPGRVSMARVAAGSRLKTYQDPEWQATAFAAELLMPANLIRGLTATQIVLGCRVSFSAAKFQAQRI